MSNGSQGWIRSREPLADSVSCILLYRRSAVGKEQRSQGKAAQAERVERGRKRSNAAEVGEKSHEQTGSSMRRAPAL